MSIRIVPARKREGDDTVVTVVFDCAYDYDRRPVRLFDSKARRPGHDAHLRPIELLGQFHFHVVFAKLRRRLALPASDTCPHVARERNQVLGAWNDGCDVGFHFVPFGPGTRTTVLSTCQAFVAGSYVQVSSW